MGRGGSRKCRNGSYGCNGNRCLACGDQKRAARREERPSRWTPAGSQNPDVGVVEGTEHVVSFKTDGNETLISDGDYSEGDTQGFDGTPGNRGHNHYGPTGSQDRGKYTGPDH